MAVMVGLLFKHRFVISVLRYALVQWKKTMHTCMCTFFKVIIL